MQTTTRPRGIVPGLPGAGLTRRTLLRGAAPLAVGLAAVPALAPLAQATPLAPADARLVELAEAHAAVEAACNAHTAAWRGRATKASEDAFGELVGCFSPIEAEMADTPADGLRGVIAKARACCCSTEPDQTVFRSLAADVWRLFGDATA